MCTNTSNHLQCISCVVIYPIELKLSRHLPYGKLSSKFIMPSSREEGIISALKICSIICTERANINKATEQVCTCLHSVLKLFSIMSQFFWMNWMKGFSLSQNEDKEIPNATSYSKNVPTYFQVSQLFKCTYIYNTYIFYNPSQFRDLLIAHVQRAAEIRILFM